MNDFHDLAALEAHFRAALVNRDSAGLVLERLGPEALDALVNPRAKKLTSASACSMQLLSSPLSKDSKPAGFGKLPLARK